MIPARETVVERSQQEQNFMLIGVFELIQAKTQEYDAYQGYLESKAAIEQASETFVFNELRAEAKTTYYQWMVLEKKK